MEGCVLVTSFLPACLKHGFSSFPFSFLGCYSARCCLWVLPSPWVGFANHREVPWATSWAPHHAQLPSAQATSVNIKSPFSASGIVSQPHLLFLFLISLLTLLYSSGSFLLHVVQEERNPGKAGGKKGLLFALVPHPWARGAGITES